MDENVINHDEEVILSYDQAVGGIEDNDDNENFGQNVGGTLYGIHMHQYIPTFREHNIGMDLFLCLNEDDLKVLGVANKDIPTLAALIKSLQPNVPKFKTRKVKDEHLRAQPETKMSMKEVLVMQCHTAKQLKQINKLLEVIVYKLKEDSYDNTLLDTDYCAARALKILCTELVRQADILCAESKNLNEAFMKLKLGTLPDKKKTSHLKFYLWGGIFMASVAPLAIVLWRSLRK